MVATKQRSEIVPGETGLSTRFKFDNAVYANVARCAELERLTLTCTSYDVDFRCMMQAEAGDIVLKHYFGGEAVGQHVDSDEGVVVGNVVWKVDLKAGRKKALKLKSEYLVLYSGLNDLDEDHISFYFQKVSRFATYPYFRAQFASLSSDSGLSLAPLPVLRERVD